jgi:hypothetical protein
VIVIFRVNYVYSCCNWHVHDIFVYLQCSSLISCPYWFHLISVILSYNNQNVV